MKWYRDESSDWIEPKALINFPFFVESFILHKHNMTWRDDSTRMVYILLKAADEQYAITNDKEGFEIF